MILDEQQMIRDVLQQKLTEYSLRNPSFSLRAFAKKLASSPSAVSEILRGKRSVSQEKAIAFCKALRLPKEVKERIDSAFSESGRLETLRRVRNRKQEVIIRPSEYELMSDWIFFALVALVRTQGFRNDPAWIANRLSVDKAEIERALKKLIDLKILSIGSEGRLVDNNVLYRTSENFPVELSQLREISGLKRAIEAIESKNELQKGVFATIALDTQRLPEALKLIEDFVKRLGLFLSEGNTKNEVFELDIQLFPLTSGQ